MGAKSSIEWTDASWTPLRVRVKPNAGEIAKAKGYTSLVQIATKMAGHVGPHCERVSDGCGKGDEGGCYSEANNSRCLPSNGTGLPFDRRARDLVDPFVDEKILVQPLRWKVPKCVFVCSQTDLFGEWVTDEMIDSVFGIMALCPRHNFQVLTKRPMRMLNYMCAVESSLRKGEVALAAKRLHTAVSPFALPSDSIFEARSVALGEPWHIHAWPLPNVWLGCSAEDQPTWDERTSILEQIPAAIRFVSLEPQLAFVDVGSTLQRGNIHWLIQGGESGRNARPMHPDWVRSTRDLCKAFETAYFFKQWGEWIEFRQSGLVTFPPKCKTIEVDQTSNPLQCKTITLCRVGRNKAGAAIDGQEWRGFPEMRT